MTLSGTTNRVSYAGNGSTTVFAFAHYFLADTDLVVIERNNSTGVETVKTLTTHYTVTGAGVAAGGSVTMGTAPASGTTLIIYRDPALLQTFDPANNDRLPAESLELAVDRLMMIAQRLDERMDRAVRLTEGQTATFDPQIPTPIVASRVLGTKSDGSGFEWTTGGGGGGGGSLVVQLNDSTVDGAATTLDFGSGFGVSSSPAGEANISLNIVNANINASAAIALSKLANVSATDRLLGRQTAGAGPIEEITCTSFARSILDDADAVAVLATIGAASATHASTHSNGGSDPVTITNLAGFPGGTSTYLRADGTFATPSVSGGTVVVQLSDSTVDASAATIDFGSGFTATSSPAGEVNIGLDIVNANINASAAIALSKLASIARYSLLGRSSVGSGAVEEFATSAFSFILLTMSDASGYKTYLNYADLGHGGSGQHDPGGIDAINWSGVVHRKGTTAGIPAAGGPNAGTLYWESDGLQRLLRSTGAAWEQVALGVAASATDKLLGRATAGAGAWEEIACTAFGRSLIDDADAAAGRTTLGAASTTHASAHQLGGSDPIKLDDLAAPDDNTDLNASTSKHGLMMKFPGGTTDFLRADGTFATPATSGGTVVVQLNESTVDASAAAIDFGSGFTATSSPAGEVNIGLDIVNAQVNASAAIAQSKLSLSITNAEVNASAAIAWSKLATVSATDKLLGRATAGAGVIEEIACTSFARSILDDADAGTVRTTISAAAATHATAHQLGGADAIKLDDLNTPDDNTDLNASTTRHGLLKKLSNVATEFLNGQGNWTTPASSTSVPSLFSGGYVTRSGTNLLFAPDVSNRVYLYSGSAWVEHTIPDAGCTVACTGLTANTDYYLYVYDNTGTKTLDLSTTAPTTQNGIQVKTGATGRLLVARCRANASGAITTYADDAATQLVCNVFNPRKILIYKKDTTDTWTYGTSSWRSLNNSTTNRVEFVSLGKHGTRVDCVVNYFAGTDYRRGLVGIGVDSTTADSSILKAHGIQSNAAGYTYNIPGVATAIYTAVMAAGYHYMQALEMFSGTSGTITFYGDNGSTEAYSGIMAEVMA